MAGFVEIPIPAGMERHEQESLRSYFQDRAQDTRSGFTQALDLTCDQKNAHAILENITINHVSVTGDSIEIGYHVELSEFQACKLLINDYSFKRTVTGYEFGNVWRFEKYVPVPERSPCDEL
jgi:hypothetical protein